MAGKIKVRKMMTVKYRVVFTVSALVNIPVFFFVFIVFFGGSFAKVFGTNAMLAHKSLKTLSLQPGLFRRVGYVAAVFP